MIRQQIGEALFILCWIFVSGCAVQKGATGVVLLNHYNWDAVSVIDAAYVKQDSNSALLKVRIATDALVSSESNAAPGSSAVDFIVSFSLQSNISGSVVFDSARQVVKDFMPEKSNRFTVEFPVQLQADRRQVAVVKLHDMNAAKTHARYLHVFPSDQFSLQQLNIVDEEGQEIEGNILRGDRPHFIIGVTGTMNVAYYDQEYPPAVPPFGVVHPKPMPQKPVSVTALEPNDQGVVEWALNGQGLYMITRGNQERSSAVIGFFGAHFPEARTVTDLLEPLRYITTNAEYREMADGENVKKEVDNHWLRLAGNPERAKTLIKAYYSRVAYANTHFTSYLEGWKSDRGMCYIVFGPPTLVKKNTSSETWIYGDSEHPNNLTLTFVKLNNPFSELDYRLERSATLKSPWYRAVEFWRQGRIVNYN